MKRLYPRSAATGRRAGTRLEITGVCASRARTRPWHRRCCTTAAGMMMRRGSIVAAVLVITAAVWTAVIRGVILTRSIAAELDRASALAQIAPRPQATIVHDRAGQPAFSFFAERRIDVQIDRVSRHMTDAIVAIEDRRFYWHHGIDPIRMVTSAWRNVRAGRIVQGGSTITQQ